MCATPAMTCILEQMRRLLACNVENDSDLSSRNEAGRPPPNLPLVRGRDFQRYRFQCYSPLASLNPHPSASIRINPQHLAAAHLRALAALTPAYSPPSTSVEKC